MLSFLPCRHNTQNFGKFTDKGRNEQIMCTKIYKFRIIYNLSMIDICSFLTTSIKGCEIENFSNGNGHNYVSYNDSEIINCRRLFFYSSFFENKRALIVNVSSF